MRDLLVLFSLLSFSLLGGDSIFVPPFLGPGEVLADSSVEISGVRVPCEKCELRNDAGCSLFFADEARELTCEAALPELLQRAAASKAKNSMNVEDLRRYVFRNDASVEGVEAAFRLLAGTKKGQEQFAADVGSLAMKRVEAFSRFLRNGDVPRPVLDAVFRLPRVKASEFIRGLSVAVDKERQPTVLIQELAAVDAKSDAEDIIEYARALKDFKPDWSARFAVFSSIVADCGNANPADFSVLCLSRQLPEGLSSADKYFLKLKTNMTLVRLPSPHVSPEDRADWLSKLDGTRFRTHESLAATRHFLAELLQHPLADQQKLLEGGNLNFARDAARYDSELAALYALLLVRYAASIWDLGSEREAVRSLLESYHVFPESLEARSSFVERISFHLPREERWYQQEWIKLSREAQAELTWVPRNTSVIIISMIAVASMLLLALAAAFVFLRRGPKRHRRSRSENAAPLISVEVVTELRTLLTYFELKLPVNEQQLTRRYRQKAKILHPDSISGTSADFSELTTRYQRAKELLGELSRFSEGKRGSNREKRA